jgi:hypothetical protein
MVNLSPEPENPVSRVEYIVFTHADCALAWRIFSDLRLWPNFCDIYGEIAWQGTPWTPGSRLRIELQPPLNATANRVITVCTPPHQVAWINHVCGNTMEQWVSFDSYHGGGTRISTWIEVTGTELAVNGISFLTFLRRVLATWFENFALECDRVAGSRSGPDHSETPIP